jgi:catechol 2,3-dioxygenase-like lactoylglutathione lyase family enzyme
MDGQLEHTNITVVDTDRTIEFLTTAFPHFKVRGGGGSEHQTWKKKWCHLGTDDFYIAIEEATITRKTKREAMEHTGINHVGFMVDDVEEIQGKMEAAGYKNSLADESPSRKRLYVTDADAITWEFVEYLSDDPAIRNRYDP